MLLENSKKLSAAMSRRQILALKRCLCICSEVFYLIFLKLFFRTRTCQRINSLSLRGK